MVRFYGVRARWPYRSPGLIEQPVATPEPRLVGAGWESGDPYRLNQDPLRRIVSVERRTRQRQAYAWESGPGEEVAFVEVLECGHDGQQTGDPRWGAPFARRRRCFWCTEYGQQCIREYQQPVVRPVLRLLRPEPAAVGGTTTTDEHDPIA